MTTRHIGALLGLEDPVPVTIVNPNGASQFLFIGDHAGIAIPYALETLGVSEADMARHIASDIGVRALGELLAARFDAVFIHQNFSRLVIDCNRAPDEASAMPEVSDGTAIPGNIGLSEEDRTARIAAIHAPYQQAIGSEIARRTAAGQRTILVALHSFTPVMNGIARPWQIGILHSGGNLSLAHAMLVVLQARGDLTVGDNEPYQMDGTDHTVPLHAFEAGLPYAEIEVRQDLIADAAGQRRWCDILAETLLAAVS